MDFKALFMPGVTGADLFILCFLKSLSSLACECYAVGFTKPLIASCLNVIFPKNSEKTYQNALLDRRGKLGPEILRQLPQCQAFNGTAFPCILHPTVVFFSIIMELHKVHNKKDVKVNSSFYLYVPTMTHPEYQIQKKNFSGLSLFYGNNHFFHVYLI